MRLSKDRARIEVLKGGRLKQLTPIPPHFQDLAFELTPGRRRTIASPRTISGISSFEAQPLTIHLSPCHDGKPALHYAGERIPIEAGQAGKGQHNIELGGVKIIEHPLSVMVGMQVDFDIAIDQPSFPTLDYCNREYIDALRDNLVDLGPRRTVTLERAVALEFERGYCLLEPDESGALTIDHQISYPGATVGERRYQAKITPPFYAFLAAARTPSFRPGGESKKNFELVRAGQTGGFPITVENVLFVDENEYYNPRPEFDWHGLNYEFLLHEIIDIIAWIKLVEINEQAAVSMRMTTAFFDHHAQIDAARCCVERVRWRAL